MEASDDERALESVRPALQHTSFETIDAQLLGEGAVYRAAMVSAGGCGRNRVCFGAALMEEKTHVEVKGLAVSGGMQKVDMRTNLHHIAAGCTSEQAQRNVIGGRSTSTFRGRIRVEQSAQQTDSQQLARSLLLNNKGRVWCIPSLEIIADDVSCAHGATISDLSDEELFYLRSRGLDMETARGLQLQAFVQSIGSGVNAEVMGARDGEGLRKRIVEKLGRIAPKGDREVKGEFQSS